MTVPGREFITLWLYPLSRASAAPRPQPATAAYRALIEIHKPPIRTARSA